MITANPKKLLFNFWNISEPRESRSGCSFLNIKFFEVLPVAYFSSTHNLRFPSKSISSDILRVLPCQQKTIPRLTKECFYKHTFNNEIYAYFTFMGNHYRMEIDFCGGQTNKKKCM